MYLPYDLWTSLFHFMPIAIRTFFLIQDVYQNFLWLLEYFTTSSGTLNIFHSVESFLHSTWVIRICVEQKILSRTPSEAVRNITNVTKTHSRKHPIKIVWKIPNLTVKFSSDFDWIFPAMDFYHVRDVSTASRGVQDEIFCSTYESEQSFNMRKRMIAGGLINFLIKIVNQLKFLKSFW